MNELVVAGRVRPRIGRYTAIRIANIDAERGRHQATVAALTELSAARDRERVEWESARAALAGELARALANVADANARAEVLRGDLERAHAAADAKLAERSAEFEGELTRVKTALNEVRAEYMDLLHRDRAVPAAVRKPGLGSSEPN